MGKKLVMESYVQPVRTFFTERLIPPFILAFFTLCIFYPFKYIPLYFLVCFLAYWITRYIYVQYKWKEVLTKMPHPPRKFWTGSFHLVTPSTLINNLLDFFEAHGPIISIASVPGFAPMISIASPNALRTIMSTHNTPKGLIMQYFERGTSWSDPLGSGWLGTGLLTSNGDLWKSRRDLITPTFHFQILQNYMQIFTSRTNVLIEKLDKLSKTPSVSTDLFPLCTDLTLDIIGACAFGIDLQCQTAAEPSNYVKAIHDITQLVFNRTFNPVYQNTFIYSLTPEGRKWAKLVRTIHQLPERLIRERRSYINTHQEAVEKKRLDFLDLLLTVKDENGEGLSELAIRNEVDTFLFEGHDTTAAGLIWTLYCLAANPEYQERARQEVDSILGDQMEPTYDQVKSQFNFLELCIKEALRLYPPVPFIVRNSEIPLELEGYNIPAGTEMILQLYTTQRNPEYWNEPNKYNPDRFITDGIKHPFAFVAFSAGHRSCVGQVFAMMEEKVIVSMLLKRFEFELDESHPVEPETHIIFRPRYGVKLRVKRRQG